MAENEIKRVNFFDGQFLKQGEFLDLDAYHLHMRRRWAFVMFDRSGVVQANPTELTIERVDPNDANNKNIRIKAGMAIGKQDDQAEAKEIVLRQDQLIDLSAQLPGALPTDIAIITVHYEEEPVANPPSEGDVSGNTRIMEHARITVHKNQLSAPGTEPFVRLGEVTFGTMALDNSQRQTAFLRASLFAPVAQTPTITLTPNQATAGPAAIPVTINVVSSGGLNLSGATLANVAISPTADISLLSVSNPQANGLTINFTLAANATAGTKTITITMGTVSAQADFVVQAGAVLALSSFSGVNEPNNDLLFKINGSGFLSPVAIEFSIGGGQFAPPITLSAQKVTSQQLTIPMSQIPVNATNGPVRVQSSGQTVTGGFDVMPPPVIATIPAQGQRQGTITITGSRFFAGTTVTFGGNAVRGPNSPTPFPDAGLGESLAPGQIIVFIPSGAATGKVKVTTNGGTVQSAAALAVAS